MIRLVAQLARLGWLSPRTIWHFYRSRRVHGQNISYLLRTTARLYPHHTALSDGATRISFAEQYEKVMRLSAVISGDPRMKEVRSVLFACGNTIDHILALYALQNRGTRVILLHAHAHPAEIGRIRQQYGEELLLVAGGAAPEGVLNTLDLYGWKEIPEAPVTIPHSTAYAPVVFPTSGTTGRPKLIEKKPGILYWLRAFADLVTGTGIHERRAVYISVPVSHGFGYTSLLFALVLGKTAVLNVDKDPERVAALLIGEQVDLLAGVPASLYRLALCLAGKPHCVRLIISGGAALNEPILNELAARLTTNIFGLYGSTESSTSFLATYEELKRNAHALGRPLRGVQYRIDPPHGDVGELVIKSPMANLHPGSWRHSGDLVAREKDGLLYWCGRKDDMIIRNGVNIYPAEIEGALLKVPGVTEAFVCGEDDPVKGEIVLAFIRMDEQDPFGVEQVRTKLRDWLPAIKIPDRIVVVQEFAYTETGKRQRPGVAVDKTKLSPFRG